VTESIGRVAHVLRALSQCSSEGDTTTGLTRRVGLPRSTTHRLLEALFAEGLADRDPRTGRWYPGPETYVLGMAAAPRYDLTKEARVSVQRLARETGESAFFSVRRGNETVVLLREDGDFPIRYYVLFEGGAFPAGRRVCRPRRTGLPARARDRRLPGAHRPRGPLGCVTQRRCDPGTAGRHQSRWLVAEPGPERRGFVGHGSSRLRRRRLPGWAFTVTGVESRFHPQRQGVLGRLLLEESHRLSRLVA
jgi:IclR family transcriptional regulator, acetate operon repressor